MSAASETAEILAFARGFCEALGARLEKHGSAYRMELPAEMRGHFGKETVSFALTAHDAWVAGVEILAPGSHLLERMYEFLQDRGTRATFHRPLGDPPSPAEVRRDVLARIHAANAEVESVHTAETWPALLAVDFKVIYQTDEREEELLRIVEDEDGTLHPADSEPGPAWDGAEPAPAEVAGRAGVEGLGDRYERLVEEARRVAVVRARPFETAAMKRLAENLARIRGYFTQIRGEISGDDERRAERLRELELEERLKTGEEVDAFRLRVRILPVALSMLAVPTRRVTVTLAGPRGGKGSLAIDWVLSSGAARAEGIGKVPALDEGGLSVALCLGGHVVADRIAGACTACGRQGCPEHRGSCPACGDLLCEECGTRCGLCERRFCATHATIPCGRCGRAACGGCGAPCAACGRMSCRDDGAACACCARIVCRDHAVRCGCGETVCPDDVVVDAVSGIRYCRRCAIACADCDRPMGKATSQLCAACGQRLCRDDARACDGCGAERGVLCGTHRARCNGCGRDVCRARHRKRCRSCTMDVCGTCLENGARCVVCVEVHRVKAPTGPLPGPDVPAEARGVKEWRISRGHGHDVYLGKARGTHLLLVVDRDGRVEKVLHR